MALPSLPLAKAGIFALVATALGGVVYVAKMERPESPSTPRKAEPTSSRRGDDPTYADELKKMAALLQDTNYRLSQAENQRILDRDKMTAQARATVSALEQKSKEEIERLNDALKDAKTALDQKIQETANSPVGAAFREQIEQLQKQQETLQKQLAEATAGVMGTAGAAGTSGTAGASGAAGAAGAAGTSGTAGASGAPGASGAADATDQRPEANRILAPRPNDTGPGAVQMAPGILDSLRNLPGMEGFAERLSARSAEAGGNDARLDQRRDGVTSKSVAGLSDSYVSLNPYNSNQRNKQAATTKEISYLPKTYPFDVKFSPDGTSAVIPVYTIPDAATLVVNATMTPLVGRVPFRGSLRDPFRFKLITGSTNLATNGLRIPGIANAVWTGYAVGVREQSCVRAYIDTVTFTFQDGRIHTVHKGKGQTEKSAAVNDNLGFLTDQWGKPCIRGRYFNNAGTYLKDRSIAAFLDGLANAYGNAQLTTYNNDGLTTYVSGNTYEYAAAQGVAGSASEIAKYVAERAQDAFDVVYVPPGIGAQIFVESQIPIDYATDGRKLRYDYTQRASYEPLD